MDGTTDGTPDRMTSGHSPRSGARSSAVPLRFIGLRQRVPGEPGNRLALGGFALALLLLFSARSEYFFTSANLLNIALAMSTVAILVVGTTALLVGGNVDLSIGSMYALVAVTVGQIAHATGGVVLPVLAGILLGTALGTVNGILVRALKLSPLIVTIGMLAILRGAAFVVSNGVPVTGYASDFVQIGRAKFLGVNLPVWVALAVFAIGAVTLVRTRAGLHLYALGGDERATMLSGVRVRRLVISTYALNGGLVGLAAVLVTARLGSVSPNLGVGLEFDVITAAILGGVAFAGGSGRPLGVLIGVLTIGILNAGLIFEGLQDYWQQVSKGTLLILALSADQVLLWWKRRSSSSSAARSSSLTGESIEALARRSHTTALGDPILEVRDLGRDFGAVRALGGVNLKVRRGEVLCLLGDNGAGKSTLIKLLSGADRPTGGSILVDGNEVSFSSPRDAIREGIHTVYQDLALAPTLSVAHNYVLGDEPTVRSFGVLPLRDDHEAEARARSALADLKVELADYHTPIRNLSGGQRQAVAIARVVHQGVKLMILDEPTAALGVAQTRNVLDLVRSVAARGTGVILITHDIETVLAIADSVAVLRLGQLVHWGPADEVEDVQLLRLMAGLVVTPPQLGTPSANGGNHLDAPPSARAVQLDTLEPTGGDRGIGRS